MHGLDVGKQRGGNKAYQVAEAEQKIQSMAEEIALLTEREEMARKEVGRLKSLVMQRDKTMFDTRGEHNIILAGVYC